MVDSLRDEALAIWHSAVAAVRPEVLVPLAVTAHRSWLAEAPRLLVVGAGKAAAGMAVALETALGDLLPRVEGLVNVPAGPTVVTQRIELHPARLMGSNEPTGEGVIGTRRMLDLFAGAAAQDVGICLLSGGGSALLPAPVEGVSLADKQAVTRWLHASGATIGDMNAVRKHLSIVKGGGLARAFTGRRLLTLILSDVVGDPLDVIASGPTAVDPTTFADALAVLDRFGLRERVPVSVREYLERGVRGEVPETLKRLPAHVENCLLGNNHLALSAAQSEAERRGYRVCNLGSFIEGETREVARVVAGIIRSIRVDGVPLRPPACVLLGGETTVRLGSQFGKGGRNQEFVLALLADLGPTQWQGMTVLSGGTDGEDGPTDAAGAVVDEAVARRAAAPHDALARHDAYPFFEACGGLLRTGLTGTNVMDVRVVLIRPSATTG